MINFKNLKGKKVVVMGLGLIGGGVGVVKWLIKNKAQVLVTDLKKKSQLKESIDKLKGLPIKYVLGKHDEKDFTNADLIIKNPAVPSDSKFLKIAKKNKIPIETDISIFFRLFKGKIIGVTGTKGKSTTSFLIYQFLKEAKKKVFLAGNIGQSPLNYLNKNYSLAVLELSSWQLEDMAHLKKSPQVAVLTTIFPDHLDRYKSFKDYIEAKKLIFKFQKKKDVLVLNFDNKITKKFARLAKGKVFYFSQKMLKRKNSLFIKDGRIIFKKDKEKEIVSLQEIKNKSNLENILAAITVACLFKVSSKKIKKILKKFKGLPNRLELIRILKGVKYYNDSMATVPQATITALKNFPYQKIILISGGADKNLNFEKMVKEIKKRCKAVILLPGSATEKIELKLSTLNFKPILKVKNMKEAVLKASSLAEKDDIVLLSPGCASFGLFQNAYHRAQEFIKAVKKL
jgi:UDP-N-acetylmuramoylalanine--D-glutamate ligase